MDLLQCYSESESDDEDVNKHVDSETHQTTNFFSLDQQSDSDSEIQVPSSLEMEAKFIEVDNQHLEIPQSSFWRDSGNKSYHDQDLNQIDIVSEAKNVILLYLKPESEQALNQIDDTKTDGYTKLECESETLPDKPNKLKQNNIPQKLKTFKCIYKPISETSPFYSTIGHNLKRNQDFEIVREKKLPKVVTEQRHFVTKNNHTLNTQQRNIFFIHGKISPFLNQRSKNKCPRTIEKQWNGHNQVVNRVQWNNGNFSHLVLSVSMDTSIKVWNVWSSVDICVKTLQCHEKAVKYGIWDPSGERILSCSYDRTAALSCVKTDSVISRLQHDGYVSCCKYHPNDPNIIITGSTNKLLAWDLRTPTNAISTYQYHDKIGQIQDIIFNYNGDTIFTCSDVVDQNSSDKNIMAWDYKTGVVLSNQIYEERYSCTRLKLHPTDPGCFLAQSQGGYIAIFSTKRPYKMNKCKRFEGHQLQGRSIGFDVSPDGTMVVSGSCDRQLYCYNYSTGKLHHAVSADLDFTDVNFHPVLPSTVVASSWNGQIQVLH